MRDFRGASIFNGEVGTIAHLDLIGAIIFLRLHIQIVSVEGNVMSTRVRILA